jgi:hypothetical protein
MLTFIRWCGIRVMVRCHCGFRFTVRPVEFTRGLIQECPPCGARTAWLLRSLQGDAAPPVSGPGGGSGPTP